jgi:hypothetical protein
MRRLRLVSRVRSPLNIEGADAPGQQDATSAHIGNMQARSNAAGRDAAAAECQRNSDSGH